MEELSTEVEANKSVSPPRRRRSTFFERRETIVPQTPTKNFDPSVSKPPSDVCNKNKEDLERYYEKLLVEKEQWKKEVNNRRHKYHDLRQQYQMEVKTSGRSLMSYAALSNDDIEFIKAKANISKLIDMQQKLHKSLQETMALHRRANELDNVILSHCEDKVNTITEYIFENSTIEAKDSIEPKD